MSFLFMLAALGKAKIENIRDGKKNRKKAKVKTGTFCKDHLKIGDEAPQMMLAIIKDNIAYLWLLLVTNLLV